MEIKNINEFKIVETNDGTISLYSNQFKESFHSEIGARKESIFKFIKPANIDSYNQNETLRVIDVCLGLGYNLCSLLEESRRLNISLNWFGLEIDKRPIEFASNNKIILDYWSTETQEIIKTIYKYNGWEKNSSKGKVLWGDARQQINNIPKNTAFDVIMLDAFSPSICPELWSEEFLIRLASKLATNGKLITYSSSAAIRASLKRAGLRLKSLKPIDSKYWSSGTVGISNKNNKGIKDNSKFYRNLSPMEEEHLLTKAAIPYRDPTGNSTSKVILRRRSIEQSLSRNEPTTNWKRRWNKAR